MPHLYSRILICFTSLKIQKDSSNKTHVANLVHFPWATDFIRTLSNILWMNYVFLQFQNYILSNADLFLKLNSYFLNSSLVEDIKVGLRGEDRENKAVRLFYTVPFEFARQGPAYDIYKSLEMDSLQIPLHRKCLGCSKPHRDPHLSHPHFKFNLLVSDYCGSIPTSRIFSRNSDNLGMNIISRTKFRRRSSS